jgi:hypothetical protein
MSSEYNFGKELKKSVFTVAPKDREELLRMIFKSYVAKLLELLMSNSKNKNALEAEMLEEVKRNLIKEFREAPLDTAQRPVKFYEDLFDTAIKEILNEAAHAHEGLDSAEVDRHRQFSINPDEYINNGGLYVPAHLKR